MEETIKYNLSASPHVRDNSSTRRIMLDVIIALIPASAYGVYRYGIDALVVILSCIAFSMLVEGVYQKLMHKDVTVTDCSAALTGLLIALNVPVGIPIWMPLLGCAFAIIMVKQLFGGLGQNFMNPALAARCFLLVAFAKYMTDFTLQGVSTATPLAQLKESGVIENGTLFNSFIGNIGGVIGEVCVPALLIGGLYLIIRRVISPLIPLVYIGTFAVFCVLFGGHLMSADLGTFTLVHLCSGGLVLGAFFMATDYVTSPVTPKGRVIYAVLLGVLTGVFRLFASSAEGVSYAIIIGNMVSPLIERFTIPQAFGVVKTKKVKQEEAVEETSQSKEKHKEPFKVKANALVVLTVITLIAGIVLGFIYQLTKDTIAKRKIADAEIAYQKVMPNAKFKELDDDYSSVVAEGFGKITVNSVREAADDSGTVAGAVVDLTTSDGFNGDIELAVGVDSEGVVTGVSILSIAETPGLGMNAESVLVPQYPGKSGLLKVKKDGGEIEPISSATITSRAVTNAVSAAIAISEEVCK